MSYDPINKIVKQQDGRIVYSNGFGGISMIEPKNDQAAKVQQDRSKISKMENNLTVGNYTNQF